MKNPLIIVLTLLVAIVISIKVVAQSTAKKSPLNVLYVGYDPSKPMPDAKRSYPGMMSKELFAAEYPIRMPAFKELLSTYFTGVETMDCRDWKPADSDVYDVTIFDFKTNPLPATDTGASGSKVPKYLPDNFSKPVIFIASTADEMGRGIGLKLDWLCLCLDADAHHFNAKHAIFKGPLEKVTPTTEMKKTPEGVFHYTTGRNLPKELPMWRVQTVGYLEGMDKSRIGLVARGNRFAEGPDAELISSGVCAKDVGAVALGRHGNFFLWGFGSSPAQMTEEAKKVFVNTVAYMKQFNGKPPITRKYNDRMGTTDDLRESIAYTNRESFDEYVKSIEDFNEGNAKEKKRIDEKRAAGQVLTSSEEESLQYIGRVQKTETYEAFLKGRMGKFFDRFGTDVAAYQQFMTDNFDYVYCNPKGFFEVEIDEDVKAIGISNHRVKLLDTCVDMLKRNDRSQLALKVLKRYTGEQFDTAKEWSNWLTKNKSKLYFSETDGYQFKINTYN